MNVGEQAHALSPPVSPSAPQIVQGISCVWGSGPHATQYIKSFAFCITPSEAPHLATASSALSLTLLPLTLKLRSLSAVIDSSSMPALAPASSPMHCLARASSCSHVSAAAGSPRDTMACNRAATSHQSGMLTCVWCSAQMVQVLAATALLQCIPTRNGTQSHTCQEDARTHATWLLHALRPMLDSTGGASHKAHMFCSAYVPNKTVKHAPQSTPAVHYWLEERPPSSVYATPVHLACHCGHGRLPGTALAV